jgi:hypothetical protein
MRYFLVLLAGLLIGMLATAYLLGARGHSLPGSPLKPPETGADTSASVVVSVDEKFFDALLGTIYQKLGPPQLKLSETRSESLLQPAVFQAACADVLVLNQEGNNVRTGVRFTGGKITAPLAFDGSYSVAGKCVQFKGTARALVDLSFDRSKQIVYGALTVEDVALDNVTPLFSALVTAFVRGAINSRVNPFEVLRVSQLALSLPIQATGGSLKAQVKDVRSEVQEGSLRLYLTYEFDAQRN